MRLLQRWIAMPSEAREAMSQRALQCFRKRYDMRENAKAIIRLFESATVSEEQVSQPSLFRLLADKRKLEETPAGKAGVEE